VDRGAWFPFSVAEKKILKGQRDILKELEAKLQQKKS
jgi:predicted NUDIX family NTP pyrophosphohydrolase